jgi:hypothetical protein
MDSWTFKRLFVRMLENGKPFFGDMFYDIKEILKEVFKYFPRRVFGFVVRVFEYMPILWSDADYDFSHILLMLQYKVKRTRQHIEKHHILANSDKYCKQMKEVEDLLDKVLLDEYAEKEHEAHDLKWGESVFVSIDVPGKPYTESRTVRLNVRTEKDKKQELKEYRAIMDLESKRMSEAWNRLFYILKNNIRHWWD